MASPSLSRTRCRDGRKAKIPVTNVHTRAAVARARGFQLGFPSSHRPRAGQRPAVMNSVAWQRGSGCRGSSDNSCVTGHMGLQAQVSNTSSLQGSRSGSSKLLQGQSPPSHQGEDGDLQSLSGLHSKKAITQGRLCTLEKHNMEEVVTSETCPRKVTQPRPLQARAPGSAKPRPGSARHRSCRPPQAKVVHADSKEQRQGGAGPGQSPGDISLCSYARVTQP